MKFWHDKKILVTGATGFVGYWLTKSLVKDQADVTILSRAYNPRALVFQDQSLLKKIRVVNGSLEDRDIIFRILIDYDIQVVFHLGAQTIVGSGWKNPLHTFESNIRGTYILLDSCKNQKTPIEAIIVASSDKAYGKSLSLPYTEDMPLKGQNPYDVSKSCADLLSFSYFFSYKLPIVVVRCGNIYGGGDFHWSRLVPGTIRSYIENKNPLIRSDGSYTRDYIYIDDVISAYRLVAMQMIKKKIMGQAFNIGPTSPYSVLEVVEAIQKQMGKEYLPPKILGIAEGEISHQSLDSEKARTILGWQNQFSLEEGLKRTIAWYENYFAKKSLGKILQKQ